MKSIRLKNIRKIRNAQITFNDFTFFIGRNNSGKSTAAKVLLLLTDYLTGDSLTRFRLDGKNAIYHKVHSYQEFITWGEESGGFDLAIDDRINLCIELQPILDTKNELLVKSLSIKDNDAALFELKSIDKENISVSYDILKIQSALGNLNLLANNQIQNSPDLSAINSKINQINEQLKNDELNYRDRAKLNTEKAKLETKLNTQDDEDEGLINPIKMDISFNMFEEDHRFYAYSVLNELSDLVPRIWTQKIEEYLPDSITSALNEDESENENKARIDEYLDSYQKLTLSIMRYVLSRISTIVFSPVNRYLPFREYIDTPVFSQMGNIDMIRDVEQLIDSDNQFAITATENKFLNHWLNEFDIAGKAIDADERTLKIEKVSGLGFSLWVKQEPVVNDSREKIPQRSGKKNFINIVDKGYGSGQVLAVLLKIIAANRYKELSVKGTRFKHPVMVILEEPEGNLHPDFQVKLVDMLIEARELFDLRFVVECHSEYMVRKFQTHVKNKTIDKQEFVINYYDENSIDTIFIEEDGYMNKEFGKGFYDVAGSLSIELL